VERARELLKALEAGSSDFQLPTARQKKRNPAQLAMFDDAPHPALMLLRDLDIDALSPIEAMTKLYELKRMAQDK
jgi:DNA mismatch repair protein MutS